MSEDAGHHFRQFAGILEKAIAKYDSHYGHLGKAEVFEMQKGQVERLATLEEDFRRALIKHHNGRLVYQAFVRHICDERRNILAARPYFRERQPIFTESISVALKERAWRRLFKFHINYQFVAFALKVVSWRPGSKVVKISRQIADARNELVEMNLPLAISRSRIFWSRTPKSHISFMDFIQIATEGMMSGIDKFCGPYSEVFRSVLIGRMVGNFIESYSDTVLHFFPTDRRRIYRANKFLSKYPHGGFDVDELANIVNKDVGPRHITSPVEIAELIAAASIVSSDTKSPTEQNVPDNVARYEAPPEARPDVQVEQAEALFGVRSAASELSLLDRKLLGLKGVNLDTVIQVG